MNKQIEKKLSELPTTPGVYFHKNKNGKVIYVGKAAVLRNRVRQYFQKSRIRDPKTDALVAEITDIDWVEVDSEMDALFLEAELIKRYKPAYNIALRDDRSDVYVRIDMKNEHPTVAFTHHPLDDSATYYGPFYSGASVRRAMKYLRRVFPYDTKVNRGKKVTLDYHIGLSPGLEESKTSLDAYRSNLRKLSMYLKGERSRLISTLEKEMKQAAKDQRFERAAVLRNQAYAFKALNRQIVFSDSEFMDISKDKGLSGLAELLKLDTVPKRIEGYDISHMSGTNNVASMVVFSNGIPDKREYRKFKMRIGGNDDFAHMREVIGRRFDPKHDSWKKPDLVLIDGGKGQLSSAVGVLREKDIDIPAIGLAKKEEDIIEMHGEEFIVHRLPKDDHISKLLQRIRNEAHRFAVSYHTSLKRSGQVASILEEVPGVGPATRKKLIKTFGSARGVAQARKWELEKIVGEQKAELIHKYLKRSRDK